MSGLPEGRVTLDWIGQKLLEIQAEQRAANQRLGWLVSGTDARLRSIEAGLLRIGSRLEPPVDNVDMDKARERWRRDAEKTDQLCKDLAHVAKVLAERRK